LSREWITRVEDINLNFREDIFDWKSGKNEKYDLKWRHDQNNTLSAKTESIVDIPFNDLMTIMGEYEFYTDLVSF
jgi:hypothetical protein